MAESISAMMEKNVLGVAANIRFSMHSGGKGACTQIFREFSGAENWPQSALEKSAVVHQSPGELCVLRVGRADKDNVKSTTLAFTG